MSTSRKLRVKLAKHRRSARKAARKKPEPEPAESSMAETHASTERGTVIDRSALTGTHFVCFCHWLSGQKLFAQEPHAVHRPLLQLRRALPPAEERAGSPGHGHRHAKPQALPQGTRQEADRMWPVRIPVPGSSIAWKDRKPIHFLSNYHETRRASTVNRRVGDWLVQLTAPQLVVDYTR